MGGGDVEEAVGVETSVEEIALRPVASRLVYRIKVSYLPFSQGPTDPRAAQLSGTRIGQ